ncbi:hypothetical protein PVAP13_1KG294810 [Panicum virgatum]|uniref:Uncharacterized protein n=1 Tax=Panicum virgatum TaxID=38727 RepID=A0A8T0XAM4_PANVG|nr:hypothetical protein PVAP13_1KG294810 [Panicum virgatum]
MCTYLKEAEQLARRPGQGRDQRRPARGRIHRLCLPAWRFPRVVRPPAAPRGSPRLAAWRGPARREGPMHALRAHAALRACPPAWRAGRGARPPGERRSGAAAAVGSAGGGRLGFVDREGSGRGISTDTNGRWPARPGYKLGILLKGGTMDISPAEAHLSELLYPLRGGCTLRASERAALCEGARGAPLAELTTPLPEGSLSGLGGRELASRRQTRVAGGVARRQAGPACGRPCPVVRQPLPWCAAPPACGGQLAPTPPCGHPCPTRSGPHRRWPLPWRALVPVRDRPCPSVPQPGARRPPPGTEGYDGREQGARGVIWSAAGGVLHGGEATTPAFCSSNPAVSLLLACCVPREGPRRLACRLLSSKGRGSASTTCWAGSLGGRPPAPVRVRPGGLARRTLGPLTDLPSRRRAPLLARAAGRPGKRGREWVRGIGRSPAC